MYDTSGLAQGRARCHSVRSILNTNVKQTKNKTKQNLFLALKCTVQIRGVIGTTQEKLKEQKTKQNDSNCIFVFTTAEPSSELRAVTGSSGSPVTDFFVLFI